MRYLLLTVLAVIGLHGAANGQFLGPQSLSQSSYVIDKDGDLWVWGWNGNGQLGIGTQTDQPTPVKLAKPAGVTSWTLVAGGAKHALAIADSTKLYAWGYNGEGELGNGTTSDAGSPVLIPNPTGVTAWKWVSAGADHSMALATDGQLYAWGANVFGQLGLPQDSALHSTPTLIPVPAGHGLWAGVAAGVHYSIGVTYDHSFFQVGKDTTGIWRSSMRFGGQLMTDGPLPFIAAGGANYFYALDSSTTGNSILRLSYGVGAQHNILLFYNGSLQCSGSNKYGQLGIPGDTNYRSFIPAPKNGQWLMVAAGANRSMAVATDGWLYAWGDNTYGQLGDGSGANQFTPTRIMQVCDSLTMRAGLIAPAAYTGTPFTISIIDTNKGPGSLTGATAYLCPSGPISVTGSRHVTLTPNSVAAGATGSYTWNANADSAGNSTYFWAYIRAKGSSPYIAHTAMQFPSGKSSWIAGRAYDSLTSSPVANAFISIFDLSGAFLNSATTGPDGKFLVWVNPATEHAAPYSISITKENYNSAKLTGTPPFEDTLHLTVPMMPAPVIGSFSSGGAPAPASFTKIFWVDSATIYGIQGFTLYRSKDRAQTWQGLTPSQKGNKLRDLFFLSPTEGWVVGNAGTFEHTTDAGEHWTHIAGAASFDLWSVCGVNDHLWAAGAGGVLLHYRAGVLTNESDKDMKLTIRSIYFLDSVSGVLATESGVMESVDVTDTVQWYRIGSAHGADLTSTYMMWPDKNVAVGVNGTVGNWQNVGSYPLASFMSAFTPHTINQVFGINGDMAYAVGDSGSSFVTYDHGFSWASMSAATGDLFSVQFYGTDGLAFSGTSPVWFSGKPRAGTTIVHGRVTAGDALSSISGAFITATDSAGRTTDSAYTNEAGHYVLAGMKPGKYTIVCYASDGHEAFSRVANTTAMSDSVIAINFSKFVAPPPPRDVDAHEQSFSLALSCEPNPAASSFVVHYALPSAGDVHIALYDMLGREVTLISDGSDASGEHAVRVSTHALANGSYFVRIDTRFGSRLTAVAVAQ